MIRSLEDHPDLAQLVIELLQQPELDGVTQQEFAHTGIISDGLDFFAHAIDRHFQDGCIN